MTPDAGTHEKLSEIRDLIASAGPNDALVPIHTGTLRELLGLVERLQEDRTALTEGIVRRVIASDGEPFWFVQGVTATFATADEALAAYRARSASPVPAPEQANA